MKEILIKITQILWEIPNMSKQVLIGIINPLDTEEQAMTMLNYLKENKDNPELMRIDRLLKKVLAISKKN